MGRIVAIAGGDLESTYAINKYIVDMDTKKLHNFLFIGTASKDAKEYIDNIKKTFEQLNCNVEELCLVTKEYTQNEIDELLAWADIIYVGGGDTFFMMEVWRKYGLDRKLKEIYLKNTAVLTGISAGAICWFNCGHSDSEIFWSDGKIGYGWINNLLNIYQYVYCPHYEQRKTSFDEMLREKELSGLAMESDTAFVERNGKIGYIKCNKSSNAYILRFNNDKLVKEQLELELLE